jgi:uncharacterized membrane protein YqaE (UPF0057 family)|nr:MAG TPA: holin [Caudoviricetes sp.]
MKDWLIRAIKTFVQAFFGVLIPEVCVLLNGGFVDWPTAWIALAPAIAAGLSAAISAVWNIIQEHLKADEI